MAHKEDKIIGLLVIDLDRRANLAILGACWASDKRQDCDWDLRRRKHREKREQEMMYKKTQLYLLTKLSQFTKQKNLHHWRIWSLRWKNGEVQIRLTLWNEIFLILWIVCIFGKMPYVTRPLYIPWGQPEPLQLRRYTCPHFGWWSGDWEAVQVVSVFLISTIIIWACHQWSWINPTSAQEDAAQVRMGDDKWYQR